MPLKLRTRASKRRWRRSSCRGTRWGPWGSGR